MRAHNLSITGSLLVSGSESVNFSDATKGVSGSFSGSYVGSLNATDVKSSLPSNFI